MEPNASVEYFIRFLREKHDNFKSIYFNLFEVLVSEDKDLKVITAEKALNAAILLRNNISSSDVPGWLSNSISQLEWYKNNNSSTGSSQYLMKNLMPFYNQISSHQWQFDSPSEILAFDFDAIYEQCKKESRLDELFENIVELLKKINESGEVDSIRIQTTLNKLIATMKNHDRASYFSIYGMQEFLLSLMKNILWEELEAIPAIGPIVKALRKTCEETKAEFSSLQKNIQNRMQEKYNTGFPFLNNQPYALLNSNDNDDKEFS